MCSPTETDTSVFYIMHFHYELGYSLVCWSVGLDCIFTATEPNQSLFSIGSRPPHLGIPRLIVLVQTHTRLLCSQMSKWTKLTGRCARFWNKCSKWESSESALSQVLPVCLYSMSASEKELDSEFDKVCKVCGWRVLISNIYCIRLNDMCLPDSYCHV